MGVGLTIASWIAEGRRLWATWKPIGDLGEIFFEIGFDHGLRLWAP